MAPLKSLKLVKLHESPNVTTRHMHIYTSDLLICRNTLTILK